MGIYHNMVFCGFGHSVEIVVYQPLAVVVFSVREDVTHIAGFHGIVAVVAHQLVCCLHVPFVVANR